MDFQDYLSVFLGILCLGAGIGGFYLFRAYSAQVRKSGVLASDLADSRKELEDSHQRSEDLNRELKVHLDLEERAKKGEESLLQEEARVFDFLHGLADALSAHARPDQLHRLIVDGAIRVLEAEAGALYLIDRNGEALRPVFLSREFPTLITPATPGEEGLRSARESLILPGDGPIADAREAWKNQALPSGDPRLPQFDGVPSPATMLCPLTYAGQRLGVLAVTRKENFPQHAIQIFEGIAEQSAFALYGVTVFSEAAEKKRLDDDLQIAFEIQRILLPINAPDFPGYQVSGYNLPAKRVSGDYYDYLPVDEKHLGVAIGDVSGKGVPASLIMAMCRSVLRCIAPGELSPVAALKRLNTLVYPDIKEDMFISAAYAILDAESSTVILARAGHDAALHYKAADSSVSLVKPPGMALGIDSGKAFNRVCKDLSLEMAPGDSLLLYTDGVTEALDQEHNEFRLERVIESFRSVAPEGAARIIARLTDDLMTFVGPNPQHDDITLIAICKK